MKLLDKEIKEIAEQMDAGLICYVNLETKEFKFIIDPDDMYADEEMWKEDMDDIKSNWKKHIKIDKMPSHESFQIMEDFAEQVTNEKIRNIYY